MKLLLRIILYGSLFYYISTLQACSVIKHKVSRTMNPTLKPYVFKFKEDLGIRTGYITVDFNKKLTTRRVGKKKRVIAGLCYRFYNHIDINPEVWKSASKIEKKALMYHELAHCVLQAPHIKGTLKDGCNASLMAPRMDYEGCYTKHWKRYIKELKRLI